MSFVGKIDGVPVYSTIMEAVVFGSQFGLQGYHEHILKGVKGYMGGVDHKDIKVAMQNGVTNFLSKNALKSGNYITDANIRDQYIANQNINKPVLTPAQVLRQNQQLATPKNIVAAMPPPPQQFPGGIVYYGTTSATYRVPADPDLYPGGANEILVFDNQGNLFNVAWPGDTQYNALKQAYINQATNGNTTGFANGVTVTNIPAIGTY